jgi:hypothetical protein
LQKQIKEVEDETTDVQKDWIQNQIELIKRQESKSKLDETNDDLLNQKSILDEKKLRINREVEQHQKRIRGLEIDQKNQDKEMNRLNETKFKNKESRVKLLNANFNIEMEFKQKLKELENESIILEN